MAEQSWRTGIYLTADVIQQHPNYVLRLRDEIGLDTVVIPFTGELPADVLSLSPYGGRTPTDAELDQLVSRHFDGRPIDPREYEQAKRFCGPAVNADGDDAAFRAIVKQLKDAGLKVWTYGGAYTIRRLTFCPSQQGTQDWFEAVYTHWATQYGLDALDITHTRYSMGSFPLGLFGCTCASCAAAATDLGYDMEKMVADLQSARQGLGELDGARLGDVARLGFGFFDVVQALGLKSGVLDWVRFRTDLITRNLSRFRSIVHEVATDVSFGTDTYPASMSLTAGHDHRRWGEMADFASPLVSHISAFVCNTFIEWARFLQEEIPNLTEEDALQVVYRFNGYDGMGLPETIDAYGAEEAGTLAYRIPTADLVLRDLVKAKLYLPPDMPSYPILHGEGWPRETIDHIVSEARRLGHNGIIWQGTDELMEYDFTA
ncbi:MAG TPA: hypothetical protein DIC52_06990 [Candidatus Latescibacteria bacterium]|jgi:hypothetical protein|nr:hypothetical protein [Candidatus Latescibacterota bacterium]